MQPGREVYEEEEDDRPNVVQTELIKSYLAFAARALRSRRLLIAAIFVPVAALTILVAVVWPRSYVCESRMLTVRSQVLETTTEGPRPLDGAVANLARRENLAAIAKKADLPRSWVETRPPILKLKDRINEAMSGAPTEAELLESLTRYLESRLTVSVEESGVLIISAEWPDPQSAARIVEAAQQTFLEGRHAAEISMIEEKISILDGHATKLRGEVESIAEQLQRMHENKLAEAGKALKDLDAPGLLPSPTPGAPRPRVSARPLTPEPDEELPVLKEKLEAKKRALSEMETDRTRRLADAQSKLVELKYKYTPAHPQVLLAEQNIETLSREPPQVPAMKEEIQQLEADIKQRGAAQRGLAAAASGSLPTPTAGGTARVSANAEPLPAKIMGLLESGVGVDPAVSTQLGGAVGKYGQLRDEIRTALIDLDKAQAAFNYRYRIVNPPEPPNKPSKPKIPNILGAGFAAALFFALIIPILLELRRGIIVERWQVHQIDLPILADLELPPGSKE